MRSNNFWRGCIWRFLLVFSRRIFVLLHCVFDCWGNNTTMCMQVCVFSWNFGEFYICGRSRQYYLPFPDRESIIIQVDLSNFLRVNYQILHTNVLGELLITKLLKWVAHLKICIKNIILSLVEIQILIKILGLEIFHLDVIVIPFIKFVQSSIYNTLRILT